MDDCVWTVRAGDDGSLHLMSKEVLPWHLNRSLFEQWSKLDFALKPLIKEGRIELYVPPHSAWWYESIAPRPPNPMEWDALLRCLGELHRAHAIGSLPHASIEPRTVAPDGTLRRHFFAYVELASRRDAADHRHGLLTGEPRFCAPELWAGHAPSFLSDVFAAAAVYCFRHHTDAWLDDPITLEDAVTWMPRERIPPSVPGWQSAILLSLLDPDPEARRRVVEHLVGAQS